MRLQPPRDELSIVSLFIVKRGVALSLTIERDMFYDP